MERTFTLDAIAKLARAYFDARDTYRAHSAAKPQPFDFENEEHIRWHIQNERLVGAVVKMDTLYRSATDAFFNGPKCADLIQLLVDVDEYFDGQEDINGNGGPNTAMRWRQEIEAFLGPVPAPKVEAAQ